MKAKLAFMLLVLAASGGGAWWYVNNNRPEKPDDRLRLSGNIETTDVAVSFKIPGKVKKRWVDEGQKVKQGEPVAELDDSDLRDQIAQRQAEVDAAKAGLDELLAGSRPEEIAASEAARQKAEAVLDELVHGSRPQDKAAAQAVYDRSLTEKDRLETELGRSEKLFQRNTISREEYDRAKAAYDVAAAQAREAAQKLDMIREGPRAEEIEQARRALAQAAAQYALVKKGPREETIAQSRAKLAQAQAALALAKTNLGYAQIVSPLTGVVLSKNVEEGEYVAPGTPIVTIGDLVNVWVRAYVAESDLGLPKLGQKAQVTTDTRPGKVYEGTVGFISQEAEFTPKNVQTDKERVKLVYRIKINITNTSEELKPGMPADVVIVVK